MAVAKQEVMPLNGDEAVAYAIKQVEPDVVAAYPITPQTIIVERFSEYVHDGEVRTEFIAAESEHSALSACVGAAAAGARAFTATASQGLALMWEVLYVASGLRLPIVMAVANRALSAPINIHCDHSDAMGARDSGWIQIFCRSSQEAYDMSICAWRIAEHPDVQLPVIVNLDGFVLSHTLENVSVLPDEAVKRFVGERKFVRVVGHHGKEVPYVLDPDNPLTIGALDLYDYYFEHRMQLIDAMNKVEGVAEEVFREFADLSGREYHTVEPYSVEGAEAVIVGLGSTMDTATVAVDELREEGYRVGAVNVRLFRPLPAKKLSEVLARAKVVAVLDRAASPGAAGAPLFTDIRAALYDLDARPLVAGYVYGLGGRDAPVEQVKWVLLDALKAAEAGRVEEPVKYVGVREE